MPQLFSQLYFHFSVNRLHPYRNFPDLELELSYDLTIESDLQCQG